MKRNFKIHMLIKYCEMRSKIVLSTCGYCWRMNGLHLATVHHAVVDDYDYLLHEPYCCVSCSFSALSCIGFSFATVTEN